MVDQLSVLAIVKEIIAYVNFLLGSLAGLLPISHGQLPAAQTRDSSYGAADGMDG
jgi:hypothetical protein